MASTDSGLTWSDWFADNVPSTLMGLPAEQGRQPWSPTEKDREAAWILYTEIRTRISTQPLHYRSGDEEAALDSLYKLFELTRKTLEDKGPECRHLATIAIHVLNNHVRPLTAKWHKKKLAGRLLNDDERRLFRQELQTVQGRLMDFCRVLGRLSEGDSFFDMDFDEPESADDGKPDPVGAPIGFERILRVDAVPGGSELYRRELESIQARRGTKGSVDNLAGFACSGGGIRSATFCLGVAQSLARRGLLPRIDILSTVSGGGYFGAFLSSYLNDSDQRVGLEAGQLPFAEPGRAEPQPIRHLRNNSKFLLKGGLLGQARMAGLMLFGILVNLLTLLPVLFLALALTEIGVFWGATEQGFHDAVGIVLAVLLGALALALFGLPIVRRIWASARERIADYEQWVIGIALSALGVWLLGWVAPWLFHSLGFLLGSPGSVLTLFVALPVLLVGVGFAIGSASLPGQLLIASAGVAGPLLLLMTYFSLNEWIGTEWKWFDSRSGWIIALLLTSAALIYWLRFVDANQISLHRYYRNRLAETYLLRRGKPAALDPQPLSQLRSANAKAPYHLINATVNLPGSKDPELRGRNSDFFLFSRHFCGSPLLGYRETEKMEVKEPGLDLGTAMAVSGAAASAYMGTLSVKGVAFWLALLNVRLGYWLPNPKKLSEIPDKLGPRPFSLWRELFGGLDEKGNFVNVSDGGHIENLGVYELLRRRCKFIIAVDAEADPDYRFRSLMRLMRHARIDFGIDVRMDLGDLQPIQSGFAKAHFVLGVIDYGDDEQGYLLYIKSSLTGNEPDSLLDYRQDHLTFPHETTADQFFDEAQFEAYRALGEHIGNDLFRPELIGQATPLTFESWFRCLVRNLLEQPV
jgi:hypothetical protein